VFGGWSEGDCVARWGRRSVCEPVCRFSMVPHLSPQQDLDIGCNLVCWNSVHCNCSERLYLLKSGLWRDLGTGSGLGNWSLVSCWYISRRCDVYGRAIERNDLYERYELAVHYQYRGSPGSYWSSGSGGRNRSCRNCGRYRSNRYFYSDGSWCSVSSHRYAGRYLH
jgi:hypothetical protein